MKLYRILIPVAGTGLFLLSRIVLKKPEAVAEPVNSINVEPEQTYGGVPLSELSELAKNIYHGIKCTIDQWGYLVFHCKSKRGHQTFRTQMYVDDTGKLINLGGHYPGEWWSQADEFAKQANEKFHFTK